MSIGSIILGVDPGSRVTGYGVIAIQNQRYAYIDSGCIVPKGDDVAVRLHQIFTQLSEVISAHRPTEFAIERVFMSKNADSALKLGQARGAAMVAGAHHSLPVSEYSAREIKQAVVGYGNAEKSQVQHMIKMLLNLSAPIQADAADALAIAICHHHHQGTKNRLQAALAKQGVHV